jgi:hypothetical protein
MVTSQEVWRNKSDEEVKKAAASNQDYNEEGQKIILAELERRAMSSTAYKETMVQSKELRAPIVLRYQDAYRVAKSVVFVGTLIRILGVCIAIIIVLASIYLATKTGAVVLLPAVMTACVLALAFWVAGVAVSALGQQLQANLDTAVNTSTLMTDQQRAEAMSL